MTFPIAPLLPPLSPVKVVDVGAMLFEQGSEPYAPLLKALPCRVVGFEPIAAECDKLNRFGQEGRTYLPYFIGDGTAQTFHECAFPMASSLFAPNTALIDKFQNLSELMRVVRSYPVETRRLDDIPEVADVDFLKLDVQGGELMVLRGAAETLRHALVVQTEALFVPIYLGQPLFADIDVLLRAQGFQFLRLVAPEGRMFKPLILQNNANASLSQMLWADVIYVRDVLAFDRLGPDALLKLAAILHENYRFFDLAAFALGAYDRATNSRLQPRYLERLVGAKPG